MFWRFGGYSNISSIDTILEKPDVTLEDLLEENDLIQELKQQNSKLIEFLREEDILKQLFQHVVADKPSPAEVSESSASQTDSSSQHGSPKDTRGKEPERTSAKISFFGRSRSRSKSVSKRKDEDSDEEKAETLRKKHAYVACEVLSAEIWSLTEAMLEYQGQLKEFWEYLRRPAPLDPVQAGYFTKVNDALLDKKTEEMFAMLKSLDGIVPEMLKHVDCPMIMDLLLKMISLEKHEGGQGIVDWLQSQGLIPILLSYLSPDNSPTTQTAAGDFLKAIITISANATGSDGTVIGPNELTRQLVSEKCITKLIDDMLHGGNALTVGVGIVIEVIRKNNSDYDLDNHVGPVPRTTDPIYLGTLLRQFAKRVPDFMKLIRSSSATRPGLKAAFGSKIEPLGFDRFKTCELMAELLHCSNMGLLNERGSDAEMRARDAERESLKAQGKLKAAPIADSEADDVFASSVDSHGFHHAQAPAEDFGGSPEKINRLEVQNASDEDGFEKVGVHDADIAYDEYHEKLEDDSISPAPLRLSRSPERQQTQIENIAETEKQDSQRVSLLTKQIQDQIDEAAASDSPTEKIEDTQHLEDKPAPLFAGSGSPSKTAAAPASDSESPSLEAEAGTQSVATLLPDATQSPLGNEPQHFEVDVDGSPVIGDLLKIQFVEQDVVPTILDFFFRFPWNNFLHNVVYDVVQQVFNGSLERGYNHVLAQNLFTESKCELLISRHELTQRILDGQAASDESQEQKGMRLGYMGHLTLIAEEVCKFAERHPPELLGDVVMDRITAPAWVTYVEGTLAETRDKDNAVLGGVRPEQTLGMRSLSGSAQSNFGVSQPSAALATAGLGQVPADSMALQESGFDMEDEAEHEERASGPVDDDEQTSPSSAPPALNIAPSRARLQLAARLAARNKADDLDESFSLTGNTGSTFDESSSSSDEGGAGREESSYHEDSDEEEEELFVGRGAGERRPSTTRAEVRSALWDE